MTEEFKAPWTISKIEHFLLLKGKQIKLSHENNKNKEEYCTTREPLIAECILDGHVWKTNIKRLFRGLGCGVCANNIKLPYVQVIERIAKEKPTIKVLTQEKDYVNTHNEIKVKCTIHGTTWDTTANHIFNGAGCMLCGHISSGLAGRADYVKVKRDIETGRSLKLLTPKEDFSVITGRVQVQCTTCNWKWKPVAYSIANKGRGCPECAKKEIIRKNTRSYEDIKKVMDSKGFDILTPKEEYTNTAMHILLKCRLDGYVWNPITCSIIAGSGCPACAKRLHPGLYSPKNAEQNKELWLTEYVTVYVIHCWDKEEEFYKIGISTHKITKRFSGERALPYKKELLYKVYTNKYRATYLEKELHEHFKAYSIIPIKYFAGYTECFYALPNIEEIIKKENKPLDTASTL